MRIRFFAAVALAVCLSGAVGSTATADLIWYAAGASGIDPYGTPWLFQNSDTAFQDVASFGMPGRAKGTTTYNGDTSVKAILLEFFDLPSGVVLTNYLPVNTPAMNVTPFTSSDLWEEEFPSPTSIRFTPPTPDRTLDPQETFFLWATFSDDVELATINFRATYVLVPEPGCVALLVLAAPLVLLIRRR